MIVLIDFYLRLVQSLTSIYVWYNHQEYSIIYLDSGFKVLFITMFNQGSISGSNYNYKWYINMQMGKPQLTKIITNKKESTKIRY